MRVCVCVYLTRSKLNVVSSPRTPQLETARSAQIDLIAFRKIVLAEWPDCFSLPNTFGGLQICKPKPLELFIAWAKLRKVSVRFNRIDRNNEK